MFNVLPETENCSLEDIEIHFSDKSKSLTNHKIQKLDLRYKNKNNKIKKNSNSDVTSLNQPPPPSPPATAGQTDESTKCATNIKQIGCDNRGFVNDK